MFCAVQYVLKEGCRWRSLPHDFPKWQNVYYHFRIWKTPGEDGETLLDKVLRKLVEAERVKNGRDEQTTMIIADSRSVKNSFTAEAGLTKDEIVEWVLDNNIRCLLIDHKLIPHFDFYRN